jgi:AcrR family transcriptional regulator
MTTTRQTRAARAAAMREGRQGRVLEAAVSVALTHGYQWITREAVAALAEVSEATVSNAFGTMRGLKRAVLTEAVNRPIPVIVAQGLADQHQIALDAPADVRQQALATLSN